jgi:carbon-monoxide dehydrogenase large subunit
VGQGIRTALAQIVAEQLQIPVSEVRVEFLDTDKTRYGIGSFASRSTVTAGSALVQASGEIIEIAKKVAAVEFEVSPADLEYRDGAVAVVGSPEHRLTIFEVASRLSPITAERYGQDKPGLQAESFFHPERVVYPCGANAAVVRVDRFTGGVIVEKLVLCYDIGRAINPMLVAGQMAGGAVQAIGGTLLEVFSYDEFGNPLGTSFMDYMLPTMAEAPEIVTIASETSTTLTNPLGIKGAGEGGVPGVAAAVAAAVEHALGRPGAVTNLPISTESLVSRG